MLSILDLYCWRWGGKRGWQKMLQSTAMPSSLFGWLINRIKRRLTGWKPWHHVHFQRGSGRMPGGLAPRQITATCSHAVVFLQLRSSSKEAANCVNLPGFCVDDSASQPCQQVVTWRNPVPTNGWGFSPLPPLSPQLALFSLFLPAPTPL